MTTHDETRAASIFDTKVDYPQPSGVRRVVSAIRSLIAGFVDNSTAAVSPATLVVRRRDSGVEVARIDTTTDDIDALTERVERDLASMPEGQFLAEWGGADRAS